MKTTDIKIAFVLILNAALSILALTCCADDNPTKMLWNVSTQTQENVDITFDASRRPQIEIFVNAEGGHCRLSCPNFKHVSFREQNLRANVHMDNDCQFHAEITAPGVITMNFDKISADHNELSTYFIIDGEDGEDTGTTVVKVTRKLQNFESFQ